MRRKKKLNKRIGSAILIGTMLFSLIMDIPMEKVKATETVLKNPQIDNYGVVTWDCIYFGKYPQSDASGQTEEPIKWRVLSVDGDDVFIVADRNLDIQQYHNTAEGVTWEQSAIRSWLNGYGSSDNLSGIDYSNNNFIDRAFSKEEQSFIKSTNVVNADNVNCQTEGGEDIYDKIFLLSYEEVTNPLYGFSSSYSNQDSRIQVNTNYAAAGGTSGIVCIDNGPWWLRSPGYNSTYAMLVTQNGYIHQYGNNVNNYHIAVRPAMRLDISETNDWSHAGTIASNVKEAEEEKRVLEAIEVDSRRTSYSIGELPSLNYFTVMAVYNNGEKQIITNYTTNISTLDMSTAGEKDLIIQYTESGITKSCKIKIAVVEEKEPTVAEEKVPVLVEAIKLTGISKKIAAGKTIQLVATVTPSDATNQDIVWSSGNEKYATVNQKGQITLKKKGAGKTVIITAVAADGSGKKANYKIKIMKHAVKKVIIKGKKTQTVKAGKSLKLKTTIRTTGKFVNKKLIWTSSNTSYATVNSKGVVRAKKAGIGKTITIIAKAKDGSGKKATIKIKIK